MTPSERVAAIIQTLAADEGVPVADVLSDVARECGVDLVPVDVLHREQGRREVAVEELSAARAKLQEVERERDEVCESWRYALEKVQELNKELHDLRARLEPWRSVATDPPPDREQVLAYRKGWGVVPRYPYGGKMGMGVDPCHNAYATHWRPLPAPPDQD